MSLLYIYRRGALSLWSEQMTFTEAAREWRIFCRWVRPQISTFFLLPLIDTYHSDGEVVIDNIQRRGVAIIVWISLRERNGPPRKIIMTTTKRAKLFCASFSQFFVRSSRELSQSILTRYQDKRIISTCPGLQLSSFESNSTLWINYLLHNLKEKHDTQ